MHACMYIYAHDAVKQRPSDRHGLFFYCFLSNLFLHTHRYTMLSNCDDAIDIDFSISLLNPGGWWYEHFSVDEQVLFFFSILFLFHIHSTCTPAYMHTCIHAYMHACMHACMHTCIHACMHTCINTHALTYTLTYIPTFMHEVRGS